MGSFTNRRRVDRRDPPALTVAEFEARESKRLGRLATMFNANPPDDDDEPAEDVAPVPVTDADGQMMLWGEVSHTCP